MEQQRSAVSETDASGLRLWLRTILHKPPSALHDRIEDAKERLDQTWMGLHDDLERRARRFEIKAIAWGAAAALMLVSGRFLLLGLWLWVSERIGVVAASIALSLFFAMLAFVPLALPRVLARTSAPARNPDHSRP